MERTDRTRSLLTALLVLSLLSLLLQWILYIPIPSGWNHWVRRSLSVGAVVCLFLLTPADRRYRSAAFFRTAMFCCAMLSLFFDRSAVIAVLNILNAVLSIFACLFEFRAHSAVTAPRSPVLSRLWRVLFFVSLGVLILSWAAALLLPLLPAGTPGTRAAAAAYLGRGLSHLSETAHALLLLFSVLSLR